MNLRDKLVVAICDNEDQSVTETGEFLCINCALGVDFLFGVCLNYRNEYLHLGLL